MAESIQKIDAHASWLLAEKNIAGAVKRGELPREKAHKILNEARTNYSNNNFNRTADRVNAGQRGSR